MALKMEEVLYDILKTVHNSTLTDVHNKSQTF